ncbi:MAG: ATP-dependent DNA helicase [Methanomassiliicoccales archaeon]
MEASERVNLILPSNADLFPFELPRASQNQFLEDARNCLASGTHLFANAPTGLGKTAVSLAAALERSYEEQGCVLFLTAKQSQHHAAIEALRLINKKRRILVVDLVAREDMCLAKKRNGMLCLQGQKCYFHNNLEEEAVQRILAFPLHTQEVIRLCLRMGTCPYLASLKALQSADCVVADYNQAFMLQGNGALWRTGRTLSKSILIVDEAHNLPDRISESHSFSLGENDLNLALQDADMRRFHDDILALQDVVRHLARRVVGEEIKSWELDEALEERCGTDTHGLASEIEEELGEEAVSHTKLMGFLSCWSAFGDGSYRFFKNQQALKHLLLDVSLISAPILEQVHTAIFMSGTLHPPEMFADILGIGERCACRTYRSPFPSKNRKLIALPGISSRFRHRGEETYKNVARCIVQVAQNTPGNMAVFFPSYDFMSSTLFHLRSSSMSKVIITDSRNLGKNERDAMLKEMRREGERALFASLGGSFAEGVDFHSNLLSAVVIVGLPLAPPSRELDAKIRWLSKRFSPHKALLYAQIYPAIAKMLQAAGRAIRSEKDRAAIILLDDRYLLNPVHDALPEDFQPSCCSDLETELRSFFYPP